jgi:hypothetical protein
MSNNVTKRAEMLLQHYRREKELVQPKISALKAKINELESGVRVDGNEHEQIMSQLRRLNNPDRVDGNGIPYGIGGVAQYIRLMNEIKNLPVTKVTPTGAHNSGKQGQNYSLLERTIEGALYQDERAMDVTRLVKAMIESNKIKIAEANIILNQFLYEPPGSSGRNTGESRLASTKYN